MIYNRSAVKYSMRALSRDQLRCLMRKAAIWVIKCLPSRISLPCKAAKYTLRPSLTSKVVQHFDN